MSRTARKLILDNVSGTGSSSEFDVEGDFLLLVQGTTVGTVQLKVAQNAGETYVNLDGGEVTESIGKVLTLPGCSLEVDYTGSTDLTIKILPYRRD